MNIRDTPEEEITMLYALRYTVSEMMRVASVKYAHRINNELYFMKWQDIFDYLTNKINELENERR